VGQRVPAGWVVVGRLHLGRGPLVVQVVLHGVAPSGGRRGHGVRPTGRAVAFALVSEETDGGPVQGRRAHEVGRARTRTLAIGDRERDLPRLLLTSLDFS
jgi:hypothetical protein